jgi:hypothetical protein
MSGPVAWWPVGQAIPPDWPKVAVWSAACMSHHVDSGRECRRSSNRAVLGPPRRSVPVGDISTPESRTLTPSIMVRIQVPQPTHLPWPGGVCASLGCAQKTGRLADVIAALQDMAAGERRATASQRTERRQLRHAVGGNSFFHRAAERFCRLAEVTRHFRCGAPSSLSFRVLKRTTAPGTRLRALIRVRPVPVNT